MIDAHVKSSGPRVERGSALQVTFQQLNFAPFTKVYCLRLVERVADN